MFILGGAALTGSAARASGALIDFESLPGGPSSDRGSISGQFSALNVTFALEGGGSPHLAQTGGTLTAFKSQWGADQPAPGEEVGHWFLTDDDTVKGVPKPIVITLGAPVPSFSGQLIDVDKNESFRIEALDADGQVLQTIQVSPAGDGMVSSWAFDEGDPLIKSVRIQYTGIKTGKVGFAVDNLDIGAPGGVIPEPASAMLAMGCGGWLIGQRRRR
jgi:hypothetical protein